MTAEVKNRKIMLFPAVAHVNYGDSKYHAVLSEALGVSMPFSSTKLAGTAAQLRLAKYAVTGSLEW